MAHVRKQARAALVAALTGTTMAGTNVDKAFSYVRATGQLPAILVTTPQENAEIDADDTLRRTLSTTIHLSAAGEASDDVLDDLAEEIEAILGLTTLGGLIKINNALVSTETSTDPEGEEVISVLSLTYQFINWTAVDNAGVVV
jgi:hypothetical protein